MLFCYFVSFLERLLCFFVSPLYRYEGLWKLFGALRIEGAFYPCLGLLVDILWKIFIQIAVKALFYVPFEVVLMTTCGRTAENPLYLG